MGAVYGRSVYGQATYGLDAPPAYLLPTFTASAVDYEHALVTWSKPSGTIYRHRLLSSSYGFPVDETDGNILIDSAAYPGGQYLDPKVTPGAYVYYGYYVLVDIADNIWVRAGLTSCLVTQNYGTAGTMARLIPEVFKTIPATGGDITSDAAGNNYLLSFLNVLGFGFDYVRTQYAALGQHLNDAIFIPVRDLWNLAAEVGMDFAPSMPARLVRKALANQAHVAQERGTPRGIANEIAMRTGWGADVTTGPNILLLDDQSQFLNPIFLPYDRNREYHAGELVWWWALTTGPSGGTADYFWNWGYPWDWFWRVFWPAARYGYGFRYQCLTEGLTATDPPTDGSSNANWQCVRDADDFLFTLANPVSSLPGTWELLDSSAASGLPATGSLTQGLGVAHPTAGAGYNAWGSLRFYNDAGSPHTYWLRSVSRRTSDLSTLPDPGFETGRTIANDDTHVSPGTPWVPPDWPTVLVTQPGENGTWDAAAYWTGANAVITWSQAHHHTGSSAALITPHTAAALAVTSPWIAVSAGTSVTGTIWAWAAAALSGANTVYAGIQWLDASGAPVSTSNGTASALTATVWGSRTVTASAPTGTRYAALIFAATNPVLLTDVVYVDDASLNATPSSTPNYPPEPSICVQDGLPVPWVRDSHEWRPTKIYATSDLVLYGGQPFTALRASIGSTPPVNNAASTDWAPLSESRRIRLAVSGYTSQNLTVGTDQSCPVYPFVEWFDQQGNWIARIFSRNPSPGTVSRPDNLAFDSFTTPSVVVTSSSPGPSVSFSTWTATYWATPDLSGPPVLTRPETSAGGSWSGHSPAPGVPVTGWSARWTATFPVGATGSYTFTLSGAGGGFRCFVNGTEVINNWVPPLVTSSGSITLQAGSTASVEVDYYLPGTEWDLFSEFIEVPDWPQPNPPAETWVSDVVATTPGQQWIGAVNFADIEVTSTQGGITEQNFNPSTGLSSQPVPVQPTGTGRIPLLFGSHTAVHMEEPHIVYPTYQVSVLWYSGGTAIASQALGSGYATGDPAPLVIATAPAGANGMRLVIGGDAGLDGPLVLWEPLSGNVVSSGFTGSLTGSGGVFDPAVAVYSTPVISIPGGALLAGDYTVTTNTPTDVSSESIDVSVYLVYYQDGELLGSELVGTARGTTPGDTFGQPVVSGTYTMTPPPLAPKVLQAPLNATQVQVQVVITDAFSSLTFGFSGVHLRYAPSTPAAASSLTLAAGAPGSATVFYTSDLTSRKTDDHAHTWATPVGDYTVGGFHGGSAWPKTPGSRSLALLTGPADTSLGLTYRTAPDPGTPHQGIIFRYSDDNNYWRADRTTLVKKTAGTFVNVGGAVGDSTLVSPEGTVTHGVTYTASAYVYAAVTLSQQMRLTLTWRNSSHATISTSTGPATTVTGGVWTGFPLTATAPAGATYAVLQLGFTAPPMITDLAWIDDVALLGVNQIAAWGNEIPWTDSGPSGGQVNLFTYNDPTYARSPGDYFLPLVFTGVNEVYGDIVAATPGTQWAASIWASIQNAGSPGTNARVGIQWLDSGSHPIITTWGPTISSLTTTWQQLSVSAAAPPGTAHAQFVAQANASGAGPEYSPVNTLFTDPSMAQSVLADGTFETTLGLWTALSGSLTRSSAHAHTGTYAAEMTPTTSGTAPAIYSVPFSDNDRMNITLSGPTITVYRNNVQVIQVSDSFNDTATSHGIVTE
jgi:hypothetical protein